MSWLDKVGTVLKQYSSGGTGTAAAPALDVNAHFDQVAQAAPSSTVAEGLAAAFRSDQTPPFGHLVGKLFANSNADQKAGMLNRLTSFVGPGKLEEVLSGAGLSGLAADAGGRLTPDQAQKLSPEVVQQLAAHAEKGSPTIVDSLSSFYAQHSSLVKTLGGSVLAVALAKIAERQRRA